MHASCVVKSEYSLDGHA